MTQLVGSGIMPQDELFIARKWVLEKTGMDKEAFFKQFGVPVELDYLE